MTKNATLTFDGNGYDLPTFTGTENETAVDISQLRAKSGLITLDSGYGNTGACTSNITFIDGEQGILRYRGYPVEELAERSSCSRLRIRLRFCQRQSFHSAVFTPGK